MKEADWVFDESWALDPQQNTGVNFLDAEAHALKSNLSVDTINMRLDKLGVSKEHTLIDFGAGSGAFALEAAKRCKVIAIDIAPEMIRYIRKQAKALNLTNIDCVCKGFLTYQYQGKLVDYVVTENALHHLPDFWKVEALRLMARCLKPRATLYIRDLVYSFEPSKAQRYISTWLSAAPSDPSEGFNRDELAAHVREEYSTYSWLFEAMLERTGFEIKGASYSENKIFASYTCNKK